MKTIDEDLYAKIKEYVRPPTKRVLLHVIGYCSMAGMAILGAFTFFAQEYGNGAVLWREYNTVIRRIEIVCAIIALIYLGYIGRRIYKELREGD